MRNEIGIIIRIIIVCLFCIPNISYGSLTPGHHYSGEMALREGVPESIRQAIQKYKGAYYLGTQGHDLTYWAGFRGAEAISANINAEKMHEDGKSGMVIREMIEDLKKWKDKDEKEYEKFLAFVAGWITHYITDAYIHYLVGLYGGNYFLQASTPGFESASNDEVRHTQLEVAENYHICKSKDVDFTAFDMKRDVDINLFLSEVLSRVYPDNGDFKVGFISKELNILSQMDFGLMVLSQAKRCFHEMCSNRSSTCGWDDPTGLAFYYLKKVSFLDDYIYSRIMNPVEIKEEIIDEQESLYLLESGRLDSNSMAKFEVKIWDTGFYKKFLTDWEPSMKKAIQVIGKKLYALDRILNAKDSFQISIGSEFPDINILDPIGVDVDQIDKPDSWDKRFDKRYKEDRLFKVPSSPPSRILYRLECLKQNEQNECCQKMEDYETIQPHEYIPGQGVTPPLLTRSSVGTVNINAIIIPKEPKKDECEYTIKISLSDKEAFEDSKLKDIEWFEREGKTTFREFNIKIDGPTEAQKGKEVPFTVTPEFKGFTPLQQKSFLKNFVLQWVSSDKDLRDRKPVEETWVDGIIDERTNKYSFIPEREDTYLIKVSAIRAVPPIPKVITVSPNHILVVKDEIKKNPPVCSHKYSAWSECNRATKKQIRSIIGKEPVGCVEKDKPVLEQECSPPSTDQREAAIKITAPAEVMATDIFQASAQISPDIAGRVSEYRWSGPALVNPDKKGGQTTKTPQATLQFQPMTGRKGDTFDPNQTISLYVSDAAGLSVASGEVTIKLKPIGFSASASWEITPVRNGFDLKRKEAIKKTPCGDRTCAASVNGLFQLRWHDDSFSPDNMDDLKKSVNNLHVGKIRGTYHGVTPGKDEDFAIGDFKGFMAHKPPQLYYTGVPDMVDLSFPSTISWFTGYLLKGKSVIFINGDVYGGGERKGEKGNFWFDDTPFVDLQTKAAYAEMMAILRSIAIGPDNKITTIPYKGPALDGSDLPRVKLVYSQKGKLKMGDVVPVEAVVENAKSEDSPLTFEWSGDHEGKGETINFMAQKAGKNTLSVTVTGARFSMGSASASFEVEDLKAVIVKDAPSANSFRVGTKARFSAALTSGGQKVSGNYIYRWQPNTEVTFEPSEGTASQATGVFKRTGKTNVWVEVLLKKGDVLSTVARSENLELDIINPKLSLSAVPETPMVGQEVKVTVQEDPKMDEKTIDFWWEIAGNAANPGPLQNNRIYTYKPKDIKPITVTVHGKGKDRGDDLGSQKITTTAKAYTISVSNPKYLGAKPRIWKCDTEFGRECPGLVEVGDTQFAVHHDLFMKASITPTVDRSKLRHGWTISPEGCTGGGSISEEIKLNCSNTGTYAAKVEVTNTDGAKLGEGTQSVTISVSQETLDNSKKAKEAYDKLQKAKELVAQGKLDEGISLAEEASKTDPKNTETANLMAKWKKEKETLLQHIGRMKKLAEEGKLTEAAKELTGAKNLHPKYQPVIDAENLLRAKTAEAREKLAKASKLRGEGEVLQNQGKLEEAIRKYRESLSYVPDKALEDHIRTLEAKVADIKKSQSAANALWEDGRVLSGHGKLNDALSKFEESLKLWSSPDRARYVKEFEVQLNQKMADAKKLRSEGESLQNQKRYEEAISKYNASLKIWPDPKLEADIKGLEAISAREKGRKETADRLWNDGTGLYDQNKLSDALTKFKESLTYWSDQIRSEYVKKMEGAKATATRLRDEGYPLQQQGMIREAIAKYRESLTYWPDAELEKYIREMEARMAQQNQQLPSPPPPTHTAFNLGKIWRVKQWIGKESWTWIWTRRGDSNTFDGAARHDQKGTESRHVIDFVSEKGGQVILSRPDAYGKYIGTLSPDGRRVVSGIMDSITRSDQGWTATIEGGQSQPVEGSRPQTLGRVWRVAEVEESPNGLKAYGTWTRRGSTDTFDAVWEISEGGGKVSDTITIESVSGDRVILFRQGNSGRYTGTLSTDRKRIVSGSMSWTYRNKSWSWTAEIDGQSATAGTGQVSSPQTAASIFASGQSAIIGKWEYHAEAYYFVDVHEFLSGGRLGNDPKASWVLENNRLTVRWVNGWVNVYTWDPQATTLKGTATGPNAERVDIRLVRMTPLQKK